MSGRPEESRNYEKIVLNYLKTKGYLKSESAFRDEIAARAGDEGLVAEMRVNTSNIVTAHNPNESLPDVYADSYVTFRDWVHSSLDQYQHELNAVLYPTFVHLYLELVAKRFTEKAVEFMERFGGEFKSEYATEIAELEGVTTIDSIKESEVAMTFRQNRYILTLTNFAYDLLKDFLHHNNLMTLLALINKYFTIRPSKNSSNGKFSQAEMTTLGNRDVYWGLYVEQIPRKATYTAAEEKAMDHKSPNPIPKIPEAEDKMLRDAEHRVPLSATSLPSICFYTLFHTHQGLTCIDMSEDASRVVGGFDDSAIRIFDIAECQVNGQGKRTRNEASPYTSTDLRAHSGPVYSTAFLGNDWFLSAGWDRTIRLWNVDTQTNLVAYRGHNYPIWALAVSPVSSFLSQFASNGSAAVNTQIGSLSSPILGGTAGGSQAPSFFASASHDRTARLWSTDNIHPLRIFAGHLSDVNTVQFHPNGNYVATGSTDKSVRLWEVQTGQAVRLCMGHVAGVSALAFSPDGRILASAGEDYVINLWDLSTSKRLGSLLGHKAVVNSLDFSADGTLLASGSSDGTVALWDWDSKRPQDKEDTPDDASVSHQLIKSFSTKKTPVFQVKFTRRNLLLAAGPFDQGHS